MLFRNFLFHLGYNKPKVPRILWDIECQEVLSAPFWRGSRDFYKKTYMQIEKDLRIYKWKIFKNEEEFKKNGEIKMQSKFFHTRFDILALYTILKMGLLHFCHDRELFWGKSQRWPQLKIAQLRGEFPKDLAFSQAPGHSFKVPPTVKLKACPCLASAFIHRK